MTTTATQQQHQQQRSPHFALGTEERFREDERLQAVRRKEAERIREQKLKEQCTFTPVANQNNNSGTNLNSSNVAAAAALAARTGSVIERLQQCDVNRRQRLEEALKQAEEAKLRGLTFKPEINPISARVVLSNHHQQHLSSSAAGSNNIDDPEQQQHGQNVDLEHMKVEDRLLREGRLASERRARMKADLERQERALLNTVAPRASSSSFVARAHETSAASSNYGDGGIASSTSFWERQQESERIAQEHREQLKAYLEHQHSFRPSINHVSAATVSMRQAEANGNQSNNGDSNDNEDNNNTDENFVSRLYDQSVKEMKRRAREREEQEAKLHSRQYTFTPRVGLRSAQLAVRRAVSQGGGTFAQRQQQAEEARQHHLQIMREAQEKQFEMARNAGPAINKNSINISSATSFSSATRGRHHHNSHLDPQELSEHVQRMAASAQQKEVKLKELAERTNAVQCPFQPATTRHSAEIVARKFAACNGDVVQRMAMEQQAARQLSAARAAQIQQERDEEEMRHMNQQQQQRHQSSSVPRASSAQRRGESVATASTGSAAIDKAQLREFFEAQDDHVRRKEYHVRQLRARLEYDEMSKCSFQPRIDRRSNDIVNNQQQQQQSMMMDESGGDFAASSCGHLHHGHSTGGVFNEPGKSVDEQVRGIGSVRARVALAAKLKAEQAEREAKAFGLRGGASSPAVNVSVPRCATLTRRDDSSASRGRRSTSPATKLFSNTSIVSTASSSTQIRKQPTPQRGEQQQQQQKRSSSADARAAKGNNTSAAQQQQATKPQPQNRRPASADARGRQAAQLQEQQQPKQLDAAAIQASLQRGRQQLFQEQRQRQHQYEAAEEIIEDGDDGDDDPPTEKTASVPQKQTSHPYVPPPDSPMPQARQRLASEVMRGAGLLPPQLLADYEADWLAVKKKQHEHDASVSQKQQLQQQEQSQAAAAPPPPAPTTSTPRMALIKKRDGVAALHTIANEDHDEQQQQQRQRLLQIPRTGHAAASSDQQQHGDYKKKSAAFDLALRRHLAEDSRARR